jgi:hypothetical protein
MNQLDVTSKKHAWDRRRRRFDCRNSVAARRRKRHRTLIEIPRPAIINRFCPDWDALRIWEDDGGGQSQLR